jgi:AcrR family transcriptional regulator
MDSKGIEPRPSTIEPSDPAVRVGLRERNKQLKLERIRAAARSLFNERGFEETTTREIAKSADIGVGTLFLYAKDKQQLLLIVYLDDLRNLIESGFAAASRKRRPLDQCLALFRPLFEHYANKPQLARLFVRELMFLHGAEAAEYAELHARFVVRLAELFSEGVRRGDLREGVDERALASNVYALYLYAVVAWLGQDAVAVDAGLESLRSSLAVQLEPLTR